MFTDVTKGVFITKVANARVLIVKAMPTPTERLRGEPFVNDERVLLEKFVLSPLGLARKDVALGWCDEPATLEHLSKSHCVITVSRLLRISKTVGWNFPELWEMAENEARFVPELARKCIAVRRAVEQLDKNVDSRKPSVSVVAKGALPTLAANHIRPVKKSKPSLQIVYGVVLDPYVVDAHDDWIPPADIEATAIKFMKDYRAISLQHERPAPEAVLVESFVEPYPTDTDRQKAHANEPHRVYTRMYGDDRIHSGAWLIGVQLPDPLWEQFKKGEIGAFSIEGFGYRENITQAAMPRVTFVELGEVSVVVGQEDTKARLT